MDLARISRRKAFLVHLALSLLVFATLVAFMLVQWFPGTLFTVDGGWQGIRIIAAVDLVLGPALTLLFFRPDKKPHRLLLIDLSLIAAVQIAALGWGIWTVYSQRTAALVFYVDRFYSVTQTTLEQVDQLLAKNGFEPRNPAAISDETPHLIYVQQPRGEARKEYFQQLFAGFPVAYIRSDMYQALPLAADSDFAAAQLQPSTLDSLARINPGLEKALADAGEELADKQQQPWVYLYEARYANALLVLDPSDGGKVLAILPYTAGAPEPRDETAPGQSGADQD